MLTLIQWFGSGEGSWSSYPGYECVPERLLLQYPTSVLVSALEATPLSPAHLEGAARLFAGLFFSRQRPEGLSEVPPGMKQRLLAHSLASNNQDKVTRARRAFGT